MSIVIDAKFNSADIHQKLMDMTQCQSIYEFEGGTELIWYQQAAGAHEALVLVKVMLDYAIRRITSDQVDQVKIISLKVISEEARIAELGSSPKVLQRDVWPRPKRWIS